MVKSMPGAYFDQGALSGSVPSDDADVLSFVQCQLRIFIEQVISKRMCQSVYFQ